uniref:transposase domain-containing protein n=1 Tax=Lachnoanaerobaculum saburreum TaxID=467210 RepID=UPI0024188C60|nr:transposase domain-containing protein [Lachnoanaerobaculum saburreum]
MVETAKGNGLNVYTYLQYLLMYMPDTQWQSEPELLEGLMPWSPDVKEECKQ